MEQVEVQSQKSVAQEPANKPELTFREVVDMALVFGGVPALVLNVLFWAVAVAFAAVWVLSTIMAFLVTILLALTGIVLIVRYVDVAMLNDRAKNEDTSMFAWVTCVFLAVCIIGCLATAGHLDGWHYTLMGAEVLLVGYQTWRALVGR